MERYAAAGEEATITAPKGLAFVLGIARTPDIETLAQAFRQYTGPLPDDFPDANAIAELLDPRLSPRRLASRWRLVVQPTNYYKKERLMVIIAFTAAAHGIEKSIPIITKDFRISRSKILRLWKKIKARQATRGGVVSKIDKQVTRQKHPKN